MQTKCTGCRAYGTGFCGLCTVPDDEKRAERMRRMDKALDDYERRRAAHFKRQSPWHGRVWA